MPLVVGLLAFSCGRSRAGDEGLMGAAGTGGSGGSAAGGGVGSAGATVGCYPPMTFEISLAADLSSDFFCSLCGALSLSFAPAGGDFFEPSLLCGATPECGACRSIACPEVSCEYEPFPEGGLELRWSGWRNVFGTCGEGMTCNSTACVEPGTYTVRVCAARGSPADFEGSTCTPSSAAPICAEAQFELPSAETVRVELGGE